MELKDGRWRATTVLAAGLLLVGCAAGSTVSATPTGGPLTPSVAASTGAAARVAAAASTGAAQGTLAVDLLFSGSRSITAKGTTGRCIVIKQADGTFAFAFEATEADYPGLGLSFSMAELVPDHVDIKWALDGSSGYGINEESRIALSANHHAIQVDEDLAGFHAQGAPAPGPERVKGTVSCP